MGDAADDMWDAIDHGIDDDDSAERARHHASRINATRSFFLPTLFPRKQRMAKARRPSVKTPLFRGSFVHLAKPRKQDKDDDGDGKYDMMIPLEKGKKATKVFIAELEKLIQAASAEKHGKAVPKELLKFYPIKDGDNIEIGDETPFADYWCISAASNFKPSAIDVNGEELTTEDELYSGAWYKAKLSAWAWVNDKGGKGVSVNLESVIKMKDDKQFGGGSNAAEDFADEVGEGGGDEDSDTDDMM